MPTPEQLELLQSKNVLVATIVISGFVDDLYASTHEEMRCFNIKNGFEKVEYRREPAVLVETGRDHAVEHALAHNYDAIMFVDADMTQFPPHSMVRLLEQHYLSLPFADSVGGYCTLKSYPYLPTIDTGTGTWENHYPGSGVMEVIRTGTAFVMVKTSAFRRFGPPWFRTKIANAPLDAMSNFENFARCKLDGRNPFSEMPEWESLMMEARRGGPGEGSIGEDSGFCDRLKYAGGRIFVDTDISVGHVGKKVYNWEDHKKAMAERERNKLLAVGVRG